jgi:hypothetical protein
LTSPASTLLPACEDLVSFTVDITRAPQGRTLHDRGGRPWCASGDSAILDRRYGRAIPASMARKAGLASLISPPPPSIQGPAHLNPWPTSADGSHAVSCLARACRDWRRSTASSLGGHGITTTQDDRLDACDLQACSPGWADRTFPSDCARWRARVSHVLGRVKLFLRICQEKVSFPLAIDSSVSPRKSTTTGPRP